MICSSSKEPPLPMLDSINVLLTTIMSLLVDNKILCLIQSITWISKSLQRLTVTTFILNFTEQEETRMAKIGKEEISFKFVFSHRMLFSTKIHGQLNTSLVMDLLFLNMYLNGLVIKSSQMQSLMVSNQKYMVVFQDLHSD